MRILCIASGGGHLEQLLDCAEALEGHERALAIWGFAARGLTGAPFHRTFVLFGGGTPGWRLMLDMLVSGFQWLWILLTYRPHAIFSTGAELAVVPFWLGRLLGARCVFLETFSRQDRPSTTGRFVRPVCDAIFVQSPTLLAYYGRKGRYAGWLL